MFCRFVSCNLPAEYFTYNLSRITPLMEFKLENAPVFTTLRITFAQGEQFKAEAGAMVSMSPSIKLESKSTAKGIFGSIKAMVGGESLFATLFTAEGGPGEVILAPGGPGDIVHLELNNQTVYAQSGAYLAGSPGLELSTKGSMKALLSGEGLFLSKITGTGTVFLNSYGSVFEKTLAAGERYIVDTGHMVAFDESVNYTVKRAASGLMSTFASGEGFVCEFVGPGRLWFQTRNFSVLANMLSRFMPGK
jgi:uncharacterized protein (TIGR00266 family)